MARCTQAMNMVMAVKNNYNKGDAERSYKTKARTKPGTLNKRGKANEKIHFMTMMIIVAVIMIMKIIQNTFPALSIFLLIYFKCYK